MGETETTVSLTFARLEDPDAEEVKEFVQNQVRLTDSVLENCETKEKLRHNLTSLIDHPRYGSPFRRGDKNFYFHNTGLQAHSVLYMQVFVCVCFVTFVFFFYSFEF